jgi:hypothetical protein
MTQSGHGGLGALGGGQGKIKNSNWFHCLINTNYRFIALLQGKMIPVRRGA